MSELASECTYREMAEILKEWTAVNLSHQTVETIVKREGEAQAQAKEVEDMIVELEEAAELPVRKWTFTMRKQTGYLFVGQRREKKRNRSTSCNYV